MLAEGRVAGLKADSSELVRAQDELTYNMDGTILATGIALRMAVLVLCLHDVQLPQTLESLLVSPGYSRSLVLECAFRSARGHDTTELPCATQPVSRFIAWLLSGAGGASGRHAPFVLVALGLAAQCASCGLVYLARRLSARGGRHHDEDDDEDADEEDEKGNDKECLGRETFAWNLRPTWRLVWIDPVSVLAVLASPLPSVVHLLLTLVWALPLVANALDRRIYASMSTSSSTISTLAARGGAAAAAAAVAASALRLLSLVAVLVLARCQAPWAALVPCSAVLLCVEASPGVVVRGREGIAEGKEADEDSGEAELARAAVPSQRSKGRSEGRNQGWGRVLSWGWVLVVALSSAAVLSLTALRHWRSLAAWFAVSNYMEPTSASLWALWPLSLLPPPADTRTTAAWSTATSSHPPSAGVHWYISAQVFSQLRAYFSLLFTGLPFVLASPVCLRFGLGARAPLLAVHLMAAVVIFFLPTTGLADGMYAASLLAGHTGAVARLRHLPPVLLGLAAAAWLSPTVLDLWLRRGTGNANFVFFQCLLMWLCAALGLSDFASSAVEAAAAAEEKGGEKEGRGDVKDKAD